MKIKLFIATILLAFGTLGGYAQNSNMFDKFSDNKDITTVYVSKTLLRMMPDMDFGVNDINIKSLAGKLEQLEIYSSQSKNAAKLIRKEADNMMKGKVYEKLMMVKDKDDNITFYGLRDKDYFKDLVMFVDNRTDKCTIIRIMGTFTLDDVQKVMDNANN
jgi:hypothetical protein